MCLRENRDVAGELGEAGVQNNGGNGLARNRTGKSVEHQSVIAGGGDRARQTIRRDDPGANPAVLKYDEDIDLIKRLAVQRGSAWPPVPEHFEKSRKSRGGSVAL